MIFKHLTWRIHLVSIHMLSVWFVFMLLGHGLSNSTFGNHTLSLNNHGSKRSWIPRVILLVKTYSCLQKSSISISRAHESGARDDDITHHNRDCPLLSDRLKLTTSRMNDALFTELITPRVSANRYYLLLYYGLQTLSADPWVGISLMWT